MGRREPGRGSDELRGGSAAAPSAPARAGGSPGRHWAEELAAKTLVAKGYEVLDRNYRLRGGELDLVCRAPDGTVVFVEVRQRRAAGHGGPGESLHAAKLRRLRRAAAHYLAVALRLPEARSRFDAVLVAGDRDGPVVRHVEDAF